MAESDAMNIEEVMKRIRPCYDRHVPGKISKSNSDLVSSTGASSIRTSVRRRLRKFMKVCSSSSDGKRSSTRWKMSHADAENVRMSVDCEEQRSLVRKSKIENVDFVGIETSPFDVRFSVNHEEPMQGEFVWDRKRSKQRTSFIRKNLSIDMTFSTGAAFDKDDENPTCYQIEMEVVDPSEISCEEELFNIAYKINDIMRILK